MGGGEKLMSANIDDIMPMYYFTAAFQNRMNKVVANCVAKANAPRQSHIMWLPWIPYILYGSHIDFSLRVGEKARPSQIQLTAHCQLGIPLEAGTSASVFFWLAAYVTLTLQCGCLIFKKIAFGAGVRHYWKYTRNGRRKKGPDSLLEMLS